MCCTMAVPGGSHSLCDAALLWQSRVGHVVKWMGWGCQGGLVLFNIWLLLATLSRVPFY